MAGIRHGGALDRAIADYGGSPNDWLDLSTGINPNAYPVPNLPDAIWQRLPGERQLQACLEAARQYYAVPDEFAVVASPGTQALIELLPFMLPASNVAIVSPTYGEHENCWRKSGATVMVQRGLNASASDALVVVNPNNPTGDICSIEALHEQAAELSKRLGVLIVDEAFCDVTPTASIVPQMADNMIVLKSFGKFFGLAGIRLGFAICAPTIAQRIEDRLGPWAAPGPALYIAEKAFRDKGWIEQAQHDLLEKRRALETLLAQSGFEVRGATNLFVSASHPDSQIIAKALAKSHILVRTFEFDHSLVRFGLPKNDVDFARLSGALQSLGVAA